MKKKKNHLEYIFISALMLDAILYIFGGLDQFLVKKSLMFAAGNEPTTYIFLYKFIRVIIELKSFVYPVIFIGLSAILFLIVISFRFQEWGDIAKMDRMKASIIEHYSPNRGIIWRCFFFKYRQEDLHKIVDELWRQKIQEMGICSFIKSLEEKLKELNGGQKRKINFALLETSNFNSYKYKCYRMLIGLTVIFFVIFTVVIIVRTQNSGLSRTVEGFLTNNIVLFPAIILVFSLFLINCVPELFRCIDRAFFDHDEYERDIINKYWKLQKLWVRSKYLEVKMTDFDLRNFDNLSKEQMERRNKELYLSLWPVSMLVAFAALGRVNLDPGIRIWIAIIGIPIVFAIMCAIYRYLVNTHQLYYKGLVYQHSELLIRNERLRKNSSPKGIPESAKRLLNGPACHWGTYLYRFLTCVICILCIVFLIGYAKMPVPPEQPEKTKTMENLITNFETQVFILENSRQEINETTKSP